MEKVVIEMNVARAMGLVKSQRLVHDNSKGYIFIINEI